MPVCKSCGQTKGLIELRDGKCRSCRDSEAKTRCRECGLKTDPSELEAHGGVCAYCTKDQPVKSTSQTAAAPTPDPIDAKAQSIIMTTGLDVPGREVLDIVQIVATEVALGMNILKDIANTWRDTFGGRSGSVQNLLKDARESCLQELKREAFRAGAQAVVAVRLNYSEASTIGGSGGGILFVAASGTAVKLAPSPTD